MKRIYAKPAGISLLAHIALLCLAMLITMQAMPPASHEPPPIEVQIDPARILDMGSGKLHVASGSPCPSPRPAARPRIIMAAAKPAPKPAPEPAPATTPVKLEEPPPALPGEVIETSVAVPLPGDKRTAGGGSVTAVGSATANGGRGAGGTGAGTGASTGEGEGGGGEDTGAGVGYGPLPTYPSSARRAGREGVVTVRILVGIDGKPVSVTVRTTSGHEDFDTSALQGVQRWRFSPARKGKEIVASFLDVRVRFRLDEAR